MTNHIPSNYSNNEIDFLDILLVVAKNIRVLIFGPLFIGLSLLGYGYTQSDTYESVSVLLLSSEKTDFSAKELAILGVSYGVLDAVAKDIGLYSEGLSVEDARRQMRSQISLSQGVSDNILNVSISSSSPQKAQHINNLLLQHIYVLSAKSANEERAFLQRQLKSSQESYNRILEFEKVFFQKVSELEGDNKVFEILSGLDAKKKSDLTIIKSLSNRLQGLSSLDCLQAPSLGQLVKSGKNTKNAIIATIIAFFLLFFFVFVRQVLKNAESNPENSMRLKSIRRAFGIF
jgi:hypothetical protein